ncbi:DUF2922 domain-containing protein [Alkaliphilus sp. MSJ-5]|uniref:DUF2922 domain-containing protein n=1 Tax=Alkaliphilus flagellatus TaxID=2841507 RepID=A0ABS6G2R0_9FIRM|nr:DUF2922 domain-containing protein [Alkaliphilus flagellatus]MBU5676649.1 DUF2922 domain-containing protein [Alkaliphilus flagellatus]
MRVLELSFKKEDGKGAKIVVANAREDITSEEVKTVMEGIISKNIFAPSGMNLAQVEGAKVIITQEQDLNLA